MMVDLEKFFSEKEIPNECWEFEHDNVVYIIDSDTVIKNILSTEGRERAQIAGTLMSLDFRKMPILPYLKYLAECMIKNLNN